ncbi:DUF4352 domain-containing protein [Staphylococcus pettenkoferi]|uniref:DUF4352 domain-containing protein n=1 Tax=Staphylococcus pettenkoferi TaxID=170573 RepID=UPI001F590B27|nr:DUF4352 domain-containing protein [Staphylococcus pettenkoferi]MCI2803952.1 DUF4352 domain-containing protein [Staphylococcus pettenkoferi]
MSNEQDISQKQQELHNQQYQEFKQQNKSGKKKWLLGCGGCLILLILIIIGISACTAAIGGNNSTNDSSSKTKDLKVGDTVKKDGVEATVTKAEFVTPDSEDVQPDNDKVLRIHYHFKNNNDDQVLFNDTDFTVNVNGDNQHEYYGGDGSSGFTHQLNKDKTGNGYVDYDVKDSDKYVVEMEATPSIDKIKANWNIKSSDIQ